VVHFLDDTLLHSGYSCKTWRYIYTDIVSIILNLRNTF
jgi:hypothetical protein